MTLDPVSIDRYRRAKHKAHSCIESTDGCDRGEPQRPHNPKSRTAVPRWPSLGLPRISNFWRILILVGLGEAGALNGVPETWRLPSTRSEVGG